MKHFQVLKFSRKAILMLCSLIVLHAQAQDRKEYDTDHYRKRMVYFEENPIGSNKIVFLGNSLTEGGKWNEYFPEVETANRGISGDNTEGMLNRIGSIIKSQPKKLFILTGINDISQNRSNNEILDNYRQILQLVKSESPNTIIYVESLLPINNEFGRYKRLIGKEKQVLSYNKELKKLAKKEKVNFINVFPIYKDKQGKLDAQYTKDGLHLIPEAYNKWANEIRKYVLD